jgi:hypothetical protein
VASSWKEATDRARCSARRFRSREVACGSWAFPRTRHTTSLCSSSSDSLLVTHPFHPLAGKRVPVLFERRYRSLGHVYICDGGALGTFTLPADFTDRGRAPGAAPFDAESLADLAAVVAALREELDPELGEE